MNRLFACCSGQASGKVRGVSASASSSVSVSDSDSDSDSEEMTLSLRSGASSYSESPWSEWSPGSFLGYKAVRIRGMKQCFAVLTLEVSSVVPVFNSQRGGRAELAPRKKMRVQAPVFVRGVRLVGPEKKMARLAAKTDRRGADALELHSSHDEKFEYRLGEASPEPRGPAGEPEAGGRVRPGCGVGIHFFIDVDSAVRYLGGGGQLLVSEPYHAPSSST